MGKYTIDGTCPCRVCCCNLWALYLEAELQEEEILAKGKQKDAPTSRRGACLLVVCWDHQPEISSPGTYNQHVTVQKSYVLILQCLTAFWVGGFVVVVWEFVCWLFFVLCVVWVWVVFFLEGCVYCLGGLFVCAWLVCFFFSLGISRHINEMQDPNSMFLTFSGLGSVMDFLRNIQSILCSWLFPKYWFGAFFFLCNTQ